MANGEDTRNHPNRRVGKYNPNSYLVVPPSNWADMSDEQKDTFVNYPGTLTDRNNELNNRGGRW